MESEAAMKSKLLLCLALVLSGIYTAFALAYFVQLKPAEMGLYPNILIRSKSDFNTGYRIFWVVILPQNNFPNANSQGSLEIYDQTNRLASCPIDGIILSDVQPKGWAGIYKTEHYMAMTNLFSKPLNGAKLFTFQVATNLLVTSVFTLLDRDDTSDTRWFYLIDFSNEK
ncbi:MAG TPA: hypothetical protein VFY06_01110 [Verrucomicrobiae bacterium]|nr:hypothetical protein [Verrucomicrobiae bacterium]